MKITHICLFYKIPQNENVSKIQGSDPNSVKVPFSLSKVGLPMGSNSGEHTHFLSGGQTKISDVGVNEALTINSVFSLPSSLKV